MDNNFAGVGLIVLGMFFFSIQDILIKLIIVDTSLLQILVFRAVAGCILLIIFLLYTKRTITLGSAYPKIAITRGLLFFFGFMLFYISISKINLAEATSLFFVSPFFMTIFSKLILKNYIGLNRIFSLLVGFSGTLLIIKPEFNNVNIYMLLPILCAFTYALSMTLAKKTSDKDNLFQQTFHIYLGAIVMGILIHVILNSLNLNYNPYGLTLLTKTWIVDDLTILFMIFFISIIGSLGIISLISAYRIGSPIINAPTEYILLIFALAGGFIFFEELPDFYSIIGMVLIILSGIYIVFRENRRNKLFVTKTTYRT